MKYLGTIISKYNNKVFIKSGQHIYEAKGETNVQPNIPIVFEFDKIDKQIVCVESIKRIEVKEKK